MFLHRARPPQCAVCHSEGVAAERHGIQLAIDGSARWWQSPTLLSGKQFEYVTITIDLKQVSSQPNQQ